MDLLEILRSKIDRLPDGEYTQGIRSVLGHIECAFRHLLRGQEAFDESAFTDAIYRCNQAFEGSLKEAYRVLATKNPNHCKPYKIEQYFESNQVFKPRVLSQFSNYRNQWRNPSTHDYMLLFDDDEAFLAIVSIAAFANLLIDQITEKISYEAGREHAIAKKDILKQSLPTTDAPLLDRLEVLITQFTKQLNKNDSRKHSIREIELTAELAGFISSAATDIAAVSSELSTSKMGEYFQYDLVLGTARESVVIELKRNAPTPANIKAGITQLTKYMTLGTFSHGVLYFYYPDNTGEIETQTRDIPDIGGKILLMYTKLPENLTTV